MVQQLGTENAQQCSWLSRCKKKWVQSLSSIPGQSQFTRVVDFESGEKVGPIQFQLAPLFSPNNFPQIFIPNITAKFTPLLRCPFQLVKIFSDDFSDLFSPGAPTYFSGYLYDIFSGSLGRSQELSPEINGDIKAISMMDCEDLVPEEDQKMEEIPEPKVGMSFDSEDDARDYYSRYAKMQGFVVFTRTSNKRKDGQKTNITYSCHRGGKARNKALNPLKAHPTSKTECKASINLSLKIDGQWLLNSVELKHNHEMCPKKARYLQANRVIPPHAKRTIELNRLAGIKMRQTITSCTIEAGGPSNLPWFYQICREGTLMVASIMSSTRKTKTLF